MHELLSFMSFKKQFVALQTVFQCIWYPFPFLLNFSMVFRRYVDDRSTPNASALHSRWGQNLNWAVHVWEPRLLFVPCTRIPTVLKSDKTYLCRENIRFCTVSIRCRIGTKCVSTHRQWGICQLSNASGSHFLECCWESLLQWFEIIIVPSWTDEATW